MEPDPVQLGQEVVAFCRDQGFALAGVCAARPTDRSDELDAWLAAGKHGDMHWLAEDAATRKDPALEQPHVRSIIMVADLYARGGGGEPDSPEPDPTELRRPRGRIARYARGRDYHWFIKRRLHRLNDALLERYPEHRFRTFVDTAPVLEREHAARAGLGWVGKHTLVIHPDLGSYMLLGGTLTTMNLARPPDSPAPLSDHCGGCTRCIDACPTGAITPYSVDARRCISYLTIERAGPIEPELHAGMGDWVFGCDICQEVCPHNRPRPQSAGSLLPSPNLVYAGGRSRFDLIEMTQWNEEAKRTAIMGTAMKRASLEMLRRNAVIALGNTMAQAPTDEGIALLRELAHREDESAAVLQAARAALDRLGAQPGA